MSDSCMLVTINITSERHIVSLASILWPFSHNIGLPALDYSTICSLLYSIKSTFHAPSLIAREIKSKMESFLIQHVSNEYHRF